MTLGWLMIAGVFLYAAWVSVGWWLAAIIVGVVVVVALLEPGQERKDEYRRYANRRDRQREHRERYEQDRGL